MPQSKSPTDMPHYIVLEGIDGTGKSTLAAGIAARLRELGGSVVVTEEPTRGPEGLEIRRRLSEPNVETSLEEWLSLFETDRQRHMREVVQPALARGYWVVQDRSFYSTAAYQGAQGADVADVIARNRALAIEPGLVLLLVLDPDVSLERARLRQGSQMEVFERADFLRRVASIFESLERENLVRLDASQPPEVVLRDALGAIESRFGIQISSL